MKLWLRIDADYPRDPRVGRLADELRIPLDEALGKVLRVHCSMAEHGPDGDLSETADATINGWAGWSPTPRRAPAPTFAQVFRRAFLTEDGIDTSYSYQQGKLHERAEKTRKRVAEWRERQKAVTRNVTRTVTPEKALPNAKRTRTVREKYAATERNGTEKKELQGVSASGDAVPRTTGLDLLPKADCDELFGLWTARRGVVAYGRFRKTVLLLFQAGVTRYTTPEISDAIAAYADWAEEQPDKEQGFCTLERFVAEIAKWVKYGKMPYVQNGEMTERGQWAGSRELREESLAKRSA